MIKKLFRKLFIQYLDGVIYNISHQDERVYFLGPAIFPQWVLACLPFAMTFNNAAYSHDVAYAGNSKHKSRFEADYVFLTRCKAASTNLTSYCFAHIYFVLVRTYGWMFWKGE